MVLFWKSPPPASGGSFNDLAGAAQPHAVYKDGKIYISHLYDAEVGFNDRVVTHLATSEDGISFNEPNESGPSRSNMLNLLEKSDSIIGNIWGGLASDSEGPEGNYRLSLDSYLHFAPDLGNVRHHTLKNQYKHLHDQLVIPTSKTCSAQPGFMTNPQGIIESNTTYSYMNEWNYNFYCRCRIGFETNVSGDICTHGLEDNQTFSLNTGEVSVTEVIFDFPETECIGNRYSSCADGSCSGAQRVRSCTAGNIWSSWMDLE